MKALHLVTVILLPVLTITLAGCKSKVADSAKGVDNLWFIELSALKGGTPCCPVPKKDAGK